MLLLRVTFNIFRFCKKLQESVFFLFIFHKYYSPIPLVFSGEQPEVCKCVISTLKRFQTLFHLVWRVIAVNVTCCVSVVGTLQWRVGIHRGHLQFFCQEIFQLSDKWSWGSWLVQNKPHCMKLPSKQIFFCLL